MIGDEASERSRRARQYFESLWSSFERACESGSPANADLKIARHRWRLRFAGATLAEMLRPAFAHLETVEGDPPDLLVGLWSASSTGIPVPAPEWSPGMTLTHSRLDSFSDDSITMVRDTYFNLLVAVDHSTGRAIYAVDEEVAIPGWERAAPLRFLINEWFANRGIQLTHAACVSRGGRGALLAGAGGSGKSTTALLCLDSGMFDYLADDYCLARPGAEPEGYSLFNSAKLHPEDLDRFPRLRPHFRDAIRNVEGEKPVVFLRDIAPDGVVAECRLDALYLPRVTDHPATTITPVGRGASWHAIAPSTMSQLLGAGPRNLALIGSIASSLPAFRLDLGSELDRIPETIAAHLEEIRSKFPPES